VADAVRGQKAIVKETRGLLSMNQPHGFDCPGCAYPEANVLVALDHYDAKSGTPSYKSKPFCCAHRRTMRWCGE
jgi:hypothetical protein